MAQVYSVNAVGYVNTVLKPGFNLISNPLIAQDNTVAALFSNVSPSIPNLLTVYVYTNGRYDTAAYDDIDERFNGDAADDQLLPGDGAFVLNPENTDLTVTFVGEVPQGRGAQALSNPLPVGFSIQSSIVPQADDVNDLGLKPPVVEQGDTIYKWNTTTRSYDVYSYDDIEENWVQGSTVSVPTLGVGEAFFLLKSTAANWVREFSVNP
jgi:hypothetical protein